jgi:hypothetical protein
MDLTRQAAKKALGAYWPIPLLLVALLFCYWRLAFFESPVKWDMVEQTYPWAMFVSDSLRAFHLPLWNPYAFYGYPFHADPQGRAWYPIVWLISALFGYSIKAVQAELFLHYVMAALFTYACSREIGLTRRASFLASLSYACSGMFVGNAEHMHWVVSVTWLPLSVFFWRRASLRGGYGYYGLLGASLGMVALGGYPAFFLTSTGIVMALIALDGAWSGQRVGIGRLAARLSTTLGLAFASSAVLLLPLMEAMGHMTRGHMPLDFVQEGSFPPYALIGIFLPGLSSMASNFFMLDISMVNVYFGIVGLVFLLYGLQRVGEDRQETVFFGLMVAFVFLSFGEYSFLRALIYKFVPLFDSFRFPTVFRGYFIFFACVLSAMGFDAFCRGARRTDAARLASYARKIAAFLAILFALAFVALAYYFLAPETPHSGPNNALLPVLLRAPVEIVVLGLLMLAASRLRPDMSNIRAVSYAILALVSLDLFHAVAIEMGRTVVDSHGDFGVFKSVEDAASRASGPLDYGLMITPKRPPDGAGNNLQEHGNFRSAQHLAPPDCRSFGSL